MKRIAGQVHGHMVIQYRAKMRGRVYLQYLLLEPLRKQPVWGACAVWFLGSSPACIVSGICAGFVHCNYFFLSFSAFQVTVAVSARTPLTVVSRLDRLYRASVAIRCIDGLYETLTHMYSDQESSKVLRLTRKVAAVFSKGKRFADSAELEELKQLRADAQARLVTAACSGLVVVDCFCGYWNRSRNRCCTATPFNIENSRRGKR